MIIESANLEPKLKTLGQILSQSSNVPHFLKFSTQNKPNMLLMNIVLGINDLDQKL